MEVVSCDRARSRRVRTRRLALSTAPWIARRRDAHPPVVAPEVVHHVPVGRGSAPRLHHLLGVALIGYEILVTNRVANSQTRAPVSSPPSPRVTVVGTMVLPPAQG